jgi:NAD-dependent dihydropyrimidine dehydrogenase PreA subunit
VLVTCNFFTTVRRLTRALQGLDLWLLVAESRGVNVWCAAGGGEFNTHSVISAIKTSGITDMVDHRTVVLPPLGAPGINAHEMARETGWTVRWGPVRAAEIPRYLAQGMHRDEGMKRVTYRWLERLDTALGSLFVIYLLGAIGFLLFGRPLFLDYLAVGAGAFLFFMLACPWLPGRHGLTKVILPVVVLALATVATLLLRDPMLSRARPDFIIAMVALIVFSSELGGMAPTMRSDLDPFLARLGVESLGNVAWASTVRADLLTGRRALTYHPEKCVACGSCAEVCPQGVWEIGDNKRAILARREDCTACRACIVQCKSAAILAEQTG